MEERGTPVGRRVFLSLLGLGAAGIAFGARAQNGLERTVAPLLAKDPSGLASLFPVGRFRIYSVTGSLPSRAKSEYRLRVHGLVDQQLNLSYHDLVSMRPTHLTRDFQCVTGWRVHNVEWTGVRLADVLDRAGVKGDAHAVRFTSFDGQYTESLTLAQARRNDVIVAYGFEGKDVSRIHGGPVRLYVAPMYGYKSLKWLDTIELTTTVVPGYWEDLGYDVDAWVGRSNNGTETPT
jgi:DMSO/TMAO reductase YedYZ molybdopterin-dependent catalytic subunit